MKDRVLIAIIILVLLASCQELVEHETPPIDIDDPTSTARDSLEAYELALWFSGDLQPSDSLVTEFLYRMKMFRKSFKDSTHIAPYINDLLAIRFMAPWTTDGISLKFDSSTAELIRNNQYDGWDLLDSLIRPTSITGPGSLPWFFVNLSGRYNPWRLSELYGILPGLVYAEPNGYGFAGGTFPIFPGLRNGEISFIFVAFNTYMPGPYYYFYYESGIPKYAGVFSRQADPKPVWWEDARISIDSFSVWQRYRN